MLHALDFYAAALLIGGTLFVVAGALLFPDPQAPAPASTRGSFLSKRLIPFAYQGFSQLAVWLARRSVSPNALSWASVLFSFFAGAAFAAGAFGGGALFATLSGCFDSLDGLVARAAGRVTPTGVVLDSSLDRYSDFLFLAGLVFYYRWSPSALFFALAAFFGSFMVSYSTAKAEAMQISIPETFMRRAERWIWLNLGAVLAVLLGRMEILLVAVGAVAALSNYAAVKRLREVARRAEKARSASSNI